MLLARSSRRLLAQRPRCRLYHSTAIVNDPPEVLRVAIVGRPNVGKSTLFNRLTGGPGGPKWSGGAAIVNAIPGTTRDRKDGKCWYGGIDMLITDTGGLEGVDEGAFGMKHRVNEQVSLSLYSVRPKSHDAKLILKHKRTPHAEPGSRS